MQRPINGSAGAEQLGYGCSEHLVLLLGTRYVLLRPEFAEAPAREISEQVRRALITVGGSDPRNLTLQLMEWAGEVLNEEPLVPMQT